VDASKGSALDLLRSRLGATAALFVGDDVTDETAFAVLRDGDVGVKVGPGETAARYRVEDPEEVTAVLELLAEERRAATA
jgi:trehalose 6-phosphate phosphatase